MSALLLALLIVSPVGLISMRAEAAESAESGSGPTFYDMGSTMVQFPTDACGYQSVLIDYQIEVPGLEEQAKLAAFHPKTESVVFDALTELAETSKKPNLKRMTGAIRRAVQGLLGKEVAIDVIVTRMEVLAN